jgi:hypothetical protein
MPTSVPPVPEGTILFHAGFHKTGTTALQSALASSRPVLQECGVLYPGKLRSHHRAAMAVTQRTWGWQSKGGRPPRMSYWERVREDSVAHPGRVIISSEAFSLASDEVVDRIVAELGPGRLHMVVTLRPFAALLASSYQQYLKYGLDVPYERWLEAVFEDPPACAPSPNFWRRNDHVGVVQRWAARLGPERVTLVVLDDADRGGLYRTFEQLLDLPAGTLVPDPAISASNRSMTAAEAEMLRLVNAGGGRDLAWPQYQNSVRRGAILRMVESRTPGPDELRLATPAWAVEAAQEVGRANAQRVTDLGVHVIGDLDRLGAPVRPGEPPHGLLLPVDAAAEAVLGAVLGTLGSVPTQEQVSRAAVDRLTTRDAAQLLGQRVRAATRRRMPGRRRSD